MQRVRADPQNFFDGIHLTEPGAKNYTGELANLIRGERHLFMTRREALY